MYVTTCKRVIDTDTGRSRYLCFSTRAESAVSLSLLQPTLGGHLRGGYCLLHRLGT